MTYENLIDAYPLAQEVIQAKAAGLPGAYDKFQEFRNSLPPDAQIALIEAYEHAITDGYAW